MLHDSFVIRLPRRSPAAAGQAGYSDFACQAASWAEAGHSPHPCHPWFHPQNVGAASASRPSGHQGLARRTLSTRCRFTRRRKSRHRGPKAGWRRRGPSHIRVSKSKAPGGFTGNNHSATSIFNLPALRCLWRLNPCDPCNPWLNCLVSDRAHYTRVDSWLNRPHAAGKRTTFFLPLPTMLVGGKNVTSTYFLAHATRSRLLLRSSLCLMFSRWLSMVFTLKLRELAI